MKHFILIFLLGISSILFAQNTMAIRTKHFNLEKTTAIQGYDAVAYFTLDKAVKGSSKIAFKHLGVTYYFSSEANKKLFEASPSKYEPQYGGWCAFAMGDYGEKVEINPETFKIVQGKLYLFYNAYLNNTLKSWNKDEKNLKAKADKNWLNIIK
jgi:YHS domain-containing protein